MLKKIKKNIAKTVFRFDMDMYTNIVGSLIITAYMLSVEKPSVSSINKKWKKLVNKGLGFWLDDPEFFEKTLSQFDLEVPYGKFAMVQSPFNCLFLPYIDGEILPIREDGRMPQTALKNPKI